MFYKKLFLFLVFPMYVTTLLFTSPNAFAMKREMPGEERKERKSHKKKQNTSSLGRKKSIPSQSDAAVPSNSSQAKIAETTLESQVNKDVNEKPTILKSISIKPENRPNAILTQHLVIAPTYAEDVRTIFEKKIIKETSSSHEKFHTMRRQAYQDCPDLSLLKIMDYSIFLRANGELIGKFNFLVNVFHEEGPNAEHNNTIYTDIGLVPDYQRKGLGAEMLKSVSDQIINPF